MVWQAVTDYKKAKKDAGALKDSFDSIQAMIESPMSKFPDGMPRGTVESDAILAAYITERDRIQAELFKAKIAMISTREQIIRCLPDLSMLENDVFLSIYVDEMDIRSIAGQVGYSESYIRHIKARLENIIK